MDVHKIQSWTKSLASLADFTFVHLHHYLVNGEREDVRRSGHEGIQTPEGI